PMGPDAAAETTLERDERAASGEAPAAPKPRNRIRLGVPPPGRGPQLISGGNEPVAVNVADIRVNFLSTLGMTDWDTGVQDNIPIEITSRPSLLYRKLF